MRKLTSVEKGGLCFGIILVVVGGWLTLFPRVSIGRIGANDWSTDKSYVLKISKKECRAYGILAVVGGLALCALAVYPLKR
jgi:hypothetical protein